MWKKNEGDVIIVIECIVFRRKGYNKGNNEDMNNYKLTVLFVNNLIQILTCYTWKCRPHKKCFASFYWGSKNTL